MALYRKYRPATFAEVVGQEHVTGPLSSALDAGRINHAYLFSGPRGCGKTSSARILARSLNCVQGPTSTPCGECGSCVALGPGGPGNLDVIELDAASHGGVDDTRELRDRAFYAPAESRYRVFIVDEAHMVSNAGFNALLKIVEEPPEHLIFIFATTEPEKVLATIKSRTHHYPFRLLPPTVMRGLLGRICASESVTVEESVYPLVIRAGGGSPRDTLSVLDQLLAGAAEHAVTYQRAIALLGVTDTALINDAVDALADRDGALLFDTVNRMMEGGYDPRRFAADLLSRIRDILFVHTIPDAAERGLVEAPAEIVERLRTDAQRIGPATLTRFAEIIHAGLGEMRGATSPRLLLEVLCARMLLPAVSDTETALLQRLEQVERALASGVAVSAAPARAPRAEVAPSRPTATADEDGGKFVRPSQRPEDAPEPAGVAAPDTARVPPPAAQPVTAPQQDRAAAIPPVNAPAPAATAIPVAPAVPAAPVRPTAPATPPAAPVSADGDAPEPAGIDPAAIRAGWREISTLARQASPFVGTIVANATVQQVVGTTITLTLSIPPLMGRALEPRNLQIVRDAFQRVLGVDEVDIVWSSGTDGATGRQHQPAAPRPAVAAPAPAAENRGPGQPKFVRRSRTGPLSAEPETPAPEPPPAQAPRTPQPPAGYFPDDAPPPAEPDYPEDPLDVGSRPAPGAAGYGQQPSARRDTPAAAGSATVAPGAVLTSAEGTSAGSTEPTAPSQPAEDDEEALLAQAASEDISDAPRRDPEDVALELLARELGAKRIE